MIEEIGAALTRDPSIALSFVIRLLTFLGACYHTYRITQLWRRNGGGQRLQNVILALVVLIGTFAILVGIFRGVSPAWASIALFIGAVAAGTLFVGMLTITLTWLLDGALKERVDARSDTLVTEDDERIENERIEQEHEPK